LTGLRRFLQYFTVGVPVRLLSRAPAAAVGEQLADIRASGVAVSCMGSALHASVARDDGASPFGEPVVPCLQGRFAADGAATRFDGRFTIGAGPRIGIAVMAAVIWLVGPAAKWQGTLNEAFPGALELSMLAFAAMLIAMYRMGMRELDRILAVLAPVFDSD
jgi:hypothetical protein